MRKKLRLLVDEDIRFIFEMSDLDTSVANFATFEDAELNYWAVDEEVLSAGQRLERVILTKDQGAGFHKRIVLCPTFNKTGVVVVTARPEQAPAVILKLAKSLSHDELVQARTEVNLAMARIERSNKSYVVEFE
jgi:predicted nuclease of predicted toxin-antitoxin system